MRRLTHRAVLLCIALALQAYGCRPTNTGSSPRDTSHAWRVLYHDSTYEVALDSSHVERQSDNAYLVWYQTRHATPQVEAGRPWNRELIHSLLRCDPLSFKTVRITLHYDAGPVVAARGRDLADVASEPWKPVTPGSVDEAALREACVVIARVQVSHRRHR